MFLWPDGYAGLRSLELAHAVRESTSGRTIDQTASARQNGRGVGILFRATLAMASVERQIGARQSDAGQFTKPPV